MKKLLFLLGLVAVAQVATEPTVITYNKVNVERLRSMGIPGIAPSLQDHVFVAVQSKVEASDLALVCVTFEEDGGESQGCAYAAINETRQAAAMVTGGFRNIDKAQVKRITAIEGKFEPLNSGEVTQ